MSTSLVTIAGITVRTDTAGRYSLNDLHQAAGADPKDQPGKFFANKTTKELVSALENSSPNLENEGPVSSTKVAGTYVVKELVYAYAMWISPEFNLKVIRAYDALVTKPVLPAPAQENLPELVSAQTLAQQAFVQVHELVACNTELVARIAEKDDHVSRLITLLEQQRAVPALPPAMLAPPAPARRDNVERMTVAAWLDRNGHTKVNKDWSLKQRIIRAVRADYERHGKPFALTKGGFGLFSAERIKANALPIIEESKQSRLPGY